MRTRLSICRKKRRYATGADALAAIAQSDLTLHPYRCDRCLMIHLTSRTKGRRRLPPALAARPED